MRITSVADLPQTIAVPTGARLPKLSKNSPNDTFQRHNASTVAGSTLFSGMKQRAGKALRQYGLLLATPFIMGKAIAQNPDVGIQNEIQGVSNAVEDYVGSKHPGNSTRFCIVKRDRDKDGKDSLITQKIEVVDSTGKSVLKGTYAWRRKNWKNEVFVIKLKDNEGRHLMISNQKNPSKPSPNGSKDGYFHLWNNGLHTEAPAGRLAEVIDAHWDMKVDPEILKPQPKQRRVKRINYKPGPKKSSKKKKRATLVSIPLKKGRQGKQGGGSYTAKVRNRQPAGSARRA